MHTPILPEILPNITEVITINVKDVVLDIDVRKLCTTDPTVYVNVSPIFKAFGVRPHDYFRTKGWKKVAVAFEERYGFPAIRTEKGTEIFDTCNSRIKDSAENRGGGGTWVHSWAVPSPLRYLSAEFGLITDEILRGLLNRETSRVDQREFLRTEHWEHSACLDKYLERNGLSGKIYYKKFFGRANKASTGHFACDLRRIRKVESTRDGLSEEEGSLLKQVLDTASTLLDLDMPFETVLSSMSKTAAFKGSI